MRKTSGKAKILYGECDAKILKAQAAMMEQAGYAVQQALGRRGMEEAIRNDAYDVVVLGHTLTRDDRHHLPYMAKKANPSTLVLVIHASGKHPGVDRAIDSRQGHNALLDVVASLLEPVSV